MRQFVCSGGLLSLLNLGSPLPASPRSLSLSLAYFHFIFAAPIFIQKYYLLTFGTHWEGQRQPKPCRNHIQIGPTIFLPHFSCVHTRKACMHVYVCVNKAKNLAKVCPYYAIV